MQACGTRRLRNCPLKRVFPAGGLSREHLPSSWESEPEGPEGSVTPLPESLGTESGRPLRIPHGRKGSCPEQAFQLLPASRPRASLMQTAPSIGMVRDGTYPPTHRPSCTCSSLLGVWDKG
uniref:Uncharacterized protein n=1 Tax=Pipistrellus kuhlii TaxID=59472 RepID=A0A7J7QUV7_PIPKU|nr:hypothetical protein mPipKuh1_008345 [Pipistrellus kuhlii]